MQALPSTPPFEVHPTSFGIALLLATALALLAVLVVVTVLLAAGKSIVPWQRVKVAAAMLALMAPALLLVAYIGLVPQAVHSERAQARSFATGERPVVSESMQRKEYRTESRKSVYAEKRETKSEPKSTARSVPTKAVVDTSKSRLVAEVEVSPEDAGSPARAAEIPAELPDGERDRQPGSLNHDTAGKPIDVFAGPLTDVLHVRQTSSTAPDWSEKGTDPSADGVLVAVSSERFATLDEAERQVTQRAVACVKYFFKDEYPLSGDWTVPISLIEQNAVNSFVGEVFDKDFGNGVTGRMYRAHLRLDMNSALRKALHRSWDDQIVSHRLMELGGILGLATLTLASFAGYLRLDDLTNGQFRGRLKMAAAALISAGGLVAWRLLA